MRWLRRLYYAIRPPRGDLPFRRAFQLYSVDGERGVEVLERRDGLIFFVDQEWVEGTTFHPRPGGQMMGPYKDFRTAERAAVTSAWFVGGQEPDS